MKLKEIDSFILKLCNGDFLLLRIWKEAKASINTRDPYALILQFESRITWYQMNRKLTPDVLYAMDLCKGHTNAMQTKIIEEKLGVDFDGDGKVGEAENKIAEFCVLDYSTFRKAS